MMDLDWSKIQAEEADISQLARSPKKPVMRIDGYYWVKHPRYGWHVGRVNHGNWFLPVGSMVEVYTDKDFEQISSRIKNPDEEAME